MSHHFPPREMRGFELSRSRTRQNLGQESQGTPVVRQVPEFQWFPFCLLRSEPLLKVCPQPASMFHSPLAQGFSRCSSLPLFPSTLGISVRAWAVFLGAIVDFCCRVDLGLSALYLIHLYHLMSPQLSETVFELLCISVLRIINNACIMHGYCEYYIRKPQDPENRKSYVCLT